MRATGCRLADIVAAALTQRAGTAREHLAATICNAAAGLTLCRAGGGGTASRAGAAHRLRAVDTNAVPRRIAAVGVRCAHGLGTRAARGCQLFSDDAFTVSAARAALAHVAATGLSRCAGTAGERAATAVGNDAAVLTLRCAGGRYTVRRADVIEAGLVCAAGAAVL